MTTRKNASKPRLLLPCVCRKAGPTQHFYGDTPGRKALSPSRFDVRFGVGLFIIISVFLAAMVFAISLIFVSFVGILILFLTLVRTLKGHSIACALRWAVIVVFGTVVSI